MKKILIVDDNENNRMLLRVLLEEYADEHNIALHMKEAVNGLEASLIAENEHFSLILMDLMMPQMDGIEATGRIHMQDPKTMIVAVSGVDDGERQEQILRNGAEDYISKPINADVFFTRLTNYFSLIEARETSGRKFNPSAVNLFTQATFSRKVLFYLQNEDELAQFWEYYLIDSSLRSESLSDTIRTMYSLASTGLKVGMKLQIVVEESIDKMFLTLIGIDDMDTKMIKLVFGKNLSNIEYKIGDGKISIQLLRPCVPVPSTFTDKSIAMTTASTYEAVEEIVQVYDYMDSEDLLDLKESIGKLNSLMLIVGGEIEAEEVDEIDSNLQQISRISSGYTDSYSIGQALSSMGNTIISHKNIFMTKSNDIAPMCAAFGRDLDSWIQLIFVEGATSVHYMDDTIIANAQTIQSILTMDDTTADDGIKNLDDIFDF